MTRRPIQVVVAAIALATALQPAEAWDNPKAQPPRAKPHRRGGAQGMPPLPLPATALRRTERKREPAPPALIGQINFSQAPAQIVDGQRVPGAAFPTTAIDIERLMAVANARLKVRYRFAATSLNKFSYDPTELPLLYITGWTALPQFDAATLGRLRRYLYDGGTLVIHAQCGRPEFVKSARQMIARLVPQRQLAPIDTDSPLYHAHFKRTTMRVRKNAEPFKIMPAYLEAVYLGCRPAVIFSPIDLNCGWDVAKNPIEGGILYHQDDALQLGVNIVTTVLANFQYARAWSTEKVYPDAPAETRDQLVIGQIVHGGDWDPTPHALPNLLKHIQAATTLRVQFRREMVDPGGPDLFKHPVLYITGLRDFKFTDAQVRGLRKYLSAGGLLIADSAAGRKAFDVAFRREIKRVLPKSALKPLPAESPLYAAPYKIAAVGYTPLVKTTHPNLTRPVLEAILVENQPAVIYSQMSLSCGWERLNFAYARGYADADALRLGVNIIAYALTH